MTQKLPVAVADAVPRDRPNDLSAEELLGFHRDMVRIRVFEEQVVEAQKAGLVPGTTHVCIAQEAIKVGAASAMRRTDQIFASYRGHGEAMMKGIDLVSLFAEIMCRSTGICHGKGGSMHLSSPEHGLVMTNGIVAAHIPIAGGAALSAKLRGTNDVVFCFFGDGASCEGEFFETLNMAQLWKVPLIFMCENNGKAISVTTEQSQATPDIADRARGVGMQATIVDGNDPVAVRAAVLEACAYARSGAGPWFIELKTVRWERHSGISAIKQEDVLINRKAWQAVDPIKRYQLSLRHWGLGNDEDFAAVERAAVEEMTEVRRKAETAPKPEFESIFDHIFATGPAGSTVQRETSA